MELSFQLRTLEPLKGAWDILRLFGQSTNERIDSDEIMDTLDLTERTFSKAMRRLITKNYVQMDGDMVYRLTDNGRGVVQELLAYDEASGDRPQPIASAPLEVLRRMVCAVPATLKVREAASVFVGFHPGDMPEDNTEVVIRLTVINGEPSTPQDVIFALDEHEMYEQISITADEFTQVRLRMEAYQLGEMGDIYAVGGMYVDVPVVTEDANGNFVAYGADVQLIG
ncbi:MAG: hypothetical protein GFH27_549395n58 [Chloroflexi bacterium AL-W]|nr:hypothetical protein [Chloroflexi bacterium AL-W]